MISDIVLLSELPEPIQQSIDAYVGCLAGALLKDDYLGKIRAAGFQNVEVVDETIFPIDLLINDADASVINSLEQMSRNEIQKLAQAIRSVKVSARKPAQS